MREFNSHVPTCTLKQNLAPRKINFRGVVFYTFRKTHPSGNPVKHTPVPRGTSVKPPLQNLSVIAPACRYSSLFLHSAYIFLPFFLHLPTIYIIFLFVVLHI